MERLPYIYFSGNIKICLSEKIPQKSESRSDFSGVNKIIYQNKSNILSR